MPDKVQRLEVAVAEITSKTRWFFVIVTTQAGLQGVGEATLTGAEDAVIAAVDHLAPAVFAMADAAPEAMPRSVLPALPQAAAFSAIDQALWDIAARRRGGGLAETIGTVRRTTIPLYANINRRTLDRSPAGFAASARAALAAGHTAFKVAPFDEVMPAARQDKVPTAAIDPGIRRLAAVREAIGPECRLMADCHWRLDEAAAERVIAAASELGMHWVECPLPETPDHFAALRRLRSLANRHGVLLAGCEQSIGIDGFMPFLDAGAYDVVMPDVKYFGGLAEILRLAEILQEAGVGFSPHNPSGPVCHAVSMHLCATVVELHSLESQFDETPLFNALAGQRLQDVTGGLAALPSSPGLGMVLQPDVLNQCRAVLWTATRQGEDFISRREEHRHGCRHADHGG